MTPGSRPPCSTTLSPRRHCHPDNSRLQDDAVSKTTPSPRRHRHPDDTVTHTTPSPRRHRHPDDTVSKTTPSPRRAMSSRRKSSTPCMVRPEGEQPAEVPMPAVNDCRPVRSPGPGEEPQEAVWGPGPGPEERLTLQDNTAVSEPSDQKRKGPESTEMDPEGDEDDDEEEEEEDNEEEGDSKTSSQETQSRGYICKYCSFCTRDLCDFKDHVDSQHPNVILNPLYRCSGCSFSTKRFDSLTEHNEDQHPGQTHFKFKRVMTEHQTVLEQTVEGSGAAGPEQHQGVPPCVIPATLQMPVRVRPLHQDPQPNDLLQEEHVAPEQSALEGSGLSPQLQGSGLSPQLQRSGLSPQLQRSGLCSQFQGSGLSPQLQRSGLSPQLQGSGLSPQLQRSGLSSQFQGSGLSPQLQGSGLSPHLQGSGLSPQLQRSGLSSQLQGSGLSPQLQGSGLSPQLQGSGLSPQFQGSGLSPQLHVSPLLQRPPTFISVPKVAVPLNTNKYNPSLDSNQTLMTSFNKFPYPTHAELSWLTAASKHPEEQIKVWFTTQRLKQGITWSPEEVEEARKKMFNGSIPPAHHTFTAPPCGPDSPSDSAPSPRPGGLRHRASPSAGRPGPGGSSSSPPSRGSVCSSYAVVRPLVDQTESQRPVMAVAPHSGGGGPKDKVLMAPPPPPPPLKDRPPVAMEMKRPAASPLVATDAKRRSPGEALMMPPPPPSASPKGRPASPVRPGLRPPMVFPPSLSRRYMAPPPPPPIVAPPYKNYGVPPHPSSLSSQERHPITHALLAPDPRTPPGPAQTKRPSIIQAPRVARHHHHPSALGHKLRGSPEPKAPCPRGDKVLTPLSEANGVPRDPHSAGLHGGGGGGEGQAVLQKGAVPSQFPLLERMKGKTAEQLKVLEETFLTNSFPSHGDLEALASSARLSRQEVRGWFLERRALRDNLEQALLNSMGSRRPQHLTPPQLNGLHKPPRAGGGGPPPAPRAPPPIVAPPGPPDARTPAPPPKEERTPARWPSAEEMVQLEARTGLPRSDLLRWFTDSRQPTLKTGLFHKMGGAGPTAPGVLQRCREGGTRNNGMDTPEANASRIAENYASSLGSRQHLELQDWFSSRLRQQSSLEMKSVGGGGAGAGGGAGELLGSWMENGHFQRPRELPLEQQQKLEG